MLKTLLLISAMMAAAAFSAVDYGTLGDDTWVQQPLSGGVVSKGGDVHWACDTSGYAYIFGACTYGGQAGGSHNSDVYRFDLETGQVEMLSNCANNRLGWISGCQNGITFDRNRNCFWIDEIGGLAVCNQAYNGGFYKYQCPNGPLTKMAGGGGGTYLAYDNVNDLVYMPGGNSLKIYDCKTNTWKTPAAYPFPQSVNTWTVPCCFDTKRGLFVITLAGPYTITNPATQVVFDVWFYNGATGQWTSKTPPSTPEVYEMELAYDEVNDRVVYFGGNCPSELWTYDYDGNAWTQIQQSGRAYNDGSPAASTWPPARHKHCWDYSPKYNACVSWGGGQWADAACTEYDNSGQPIWVYRLSKNGTRIDASTIRMPVQTGFSVYPNPFSSRAAINFTGGPASLKVFDANGRLVYALAPPVWTGSVIRAAGWPAGIYLARLIQGKTVFEKRLIIMK
jgi:hypothetical protein